MNYLTEEHIACIAVLYQQWRAEEGISAIITADKAARNDYNLSPSRYVSVNGKEEVLTLEETVVRLQETEEERAEAKRGAEQIGFIPCQQIMKQEGRSKWSKQSRTFFTYLLMLLMNSSISTIFEGSFFSVRPCAKIWNLICTFWSSLIPTHLWVFCD